MRRTLWSPPPSSIQRSDIDPAALCPPLLELWGRPLDQVVGKTFAELGYPQDLVDLHGRQLDEALTGKTVSGGNSYVNPQGKRGEYEYTFVPVIGDDGRVQTIVGTTRDVTERRAADLERAQALEKLQESEAQFRHFADAMPQLAWIARSDGFIVWYNRRWYEYTGTTPSQMEGWGWQSVHDPSALTLVLERRKTSIVTGEPFEMTFPLRAASGRFRQFLTRVNPVRNAQGEVVRWFGTNTDIDTEQQMIEERDAALETARTANRAKDEFLAMLGHELRNPLSPIVTALQLQRLRGQQGKEHAIIERQVTHLVRLVDDLLDVARINEGKVQLRMKPLELGSAVLAGIEMVNALLGTRRQTLKVGVPAVGLLVSGDLERLSQVVANLLSNASKYSDVGTQIEVRAERQGSTVRLFVRDHGVGIPAEMIGHIFGMFVQHRQALDRSSGGLGLGLSIVQSLVALHHGQVQATSTGSGQGSEFVVTLPALADAQTGVDEATPAMSVTKATASKRVLVVDDNEDAALLLADILRETGVDVRVAHSAPEALAVAARFQPQIGILDIGLPVMDGYELGRRLREQAPTTALRLVALTGYGQPSDLRRSQGEGFIAHLVKPVDIAKVTALIETEIGSSDQGKENVRRRR